MLSHEINTTLGEQVTWAERTTSDVMTISDQEVHVWSVPLQLQDEQVAIAKSLLNAHQVDRYQRRIKTGGEQAYLAGRYYLMQLLSAYTDVAANQVQLQYTRLNKPYLQDNPNGIAFNFTDSQTDHGSVGLYAFYRGDNIGVDIESLYRRSNFEPIANRKFTPREQALVKSTEQFDAQKFLALWTRKEAYGKATGQGVNYKMNKLDLASPEHHSLSFDAEGVKAGAEQRVSRFQLSQFMVDDQHIGCTVYQANQKREIRFFNLLNASP